MKRTWENTLTITVAAPMGVAGDDVVFLKRAFQ